MKLILSLILTLTLNNVVANEVYNGRYGWPKQKAPQKIIVCNSDRLSTAELMLLESLSGLAAQAVNCGAFDEMVWIETPNHSYQQIFESSVKELGIKKISYMSVWDLLDYLKQKKVVRGYIAYKLDHSKGELYSRREGINYSCNVATVYAGVLQGVLADESLFNSMQQRGIKKIKDARQESMKQCFNKNKEKLNKCSAASIDPQVTNCRDIVIAQKLMVYYDTDILFHVVISSRKIN